ncbi:DUF4422 domain-containing protein, partial [Liquorilactobacillus sp.]
MNNSNLIIVVSHKNGKIEDHIPYKPILVGKNICKEKSYWQDDIGENIANKNRNYCELTALYWVWKNQNDNFDIFGLNHYRRFFKGRNGNTLSNKEINVFLKKYDIILPKKLYWKKTVCENYYKNGNGFRKDLIIIRDILLDKYPEYVETFDYVLGKNSSSYYNMFVMKKINFNNYCTWLFDILFESEKKIDISGYDTQEARVFGYLAEILINVWVFKNNMKIKYLPIKNTNFFLFNIRMG